MIRSEEVPPEEFRHVLGHFATGVVVLTADGADGAAGMACNSFTAVSLQPPLVAVCPAKSSETWPAIRAAGCFTANVMHEDHEDLVRTFARKGTDRFASASHHRRLCGPALDEALAWIECEIEVEHEAGDHTIAVARVLALEARPEIRPLLFFRGDYGRLADQNLLTKPTTKKDR